jgi:hypothetical protein
LYGYEAQFLTLREEHRLKVSENRVLRKKFGPKWGDIREGWGKLHNERLHNFYCPPDIIRVIKSSRVRWKCLMAHMGEVRMYTKPW